MLLRAQPAERVAWLGNLGIGLLATAYGAALPALVHELHRGYAALSLLFVVLAVGNTFAYFLANPLIDRFGAQRVLHVGLLLFVVGGLALGVVQSFAAWVAATLVAGVAFSLVDVGASRLVGAMYRSHPAQALNRLNIFFGIGAIAAPVIIGLSVHLGGGPQPAFLAIALCGAVGGTALVRIPLPPSEPVVHRDPDDSLVRYFGRARWLQLLTLLVFFYIAAEVGFGSWIAAYEHQRAGISTALSALYPAAYQVGLTVVRLFVGRSLASLRLERLLALGGLVAAAASLLAALGGQNPWFALIGAFLAGAGFGPVFPIALGIASLRGPGREGWTYGAVFSALALAALIAPWSEGQVFSRMPQLALLLTPLCAVMVVVFAMMLGRTSAGPTEAAQG
ncbi:MAG: MFS transporter [Thermaerobacter sp.]|nr:MFS transporter [Thermaerobacter sp.]